MREEGHILVTGGAGFIGSHLVERLLVDGNRVVVIDDVSTGSLENLERVQGDSKLTVIESKVSQCSELGSLVADARFVFHLAAAVGVELILRKPVESLRTNLDETEAVLQAAAARKTPILLASTSEVYGKSDKEEFSESDDLLIGPPTLVRWSYACSKLMDEFLALSFMKENGVPVIVARLFNTVGPRQSGEFGMVLPRFIEAGRRREQIRVFGDGRQTRCFCHVRDTVEALVRLMNCERARGEVVNIGNSNEIAIRELARKVNEACGSDSPIELVPYSEAYGPGFEDMLRRRPDISRLRELTGFAPSISLDEIIKEMALADTEETAN